MKDIKLPKEIETKQLRITFLPEERNMRGYGETFVNIQVHIKNTHDSLDLEELSKDLADLGKLRRYKEFKKDLE